MTVPVSYHIETNFPDVGISQDALSMLHISILSLQFEWMNGSLTFSMEIIYYMVAIFVPNETPSCSLRFVQFASTFSITTLFFEGFFLVEYVVVHRVPIFRIPFTLLPGNIKHSSDDIRPNVPMLHFRYKQWPNSPWYANKRVHSNEGYRITDNVGGEPRTAEIQIYYYMLEKHIYFLWHK